MTTPGDARIIDQGYRRYDGPRGGQREAMKTVTKHSIQRSLGMKRTIWQKILPVVVIALAFLPAVGIVGAAALFRGAFDAEDLISYPDYFGIISFAILLFSAFVAPEVLCTDRRTGQLGMYLAAPLTRNTYLLSKAIAVAIVLSIVTIGPQLLMLIAYTFESAGPGSVGEFFKLLAQIISGGAVVSILYAAFSLAVSSLTDRRAFASAGFVVVSLVTGLVSNVLTEVAEASNYWALLSFTDIPVTLVYRIFGDETSDPGAIAEMSTALLSLAYLGWLALFVAVIYWTYQRLVVTR